MVLIFFRSMIPRALIMLYLFVGAVCLELGTDNLCTYMMYSTLVGYNVRVRVRVL